MPGLRLGLGAGVVGQSGGAFDYVVDSVNGNDANSGKAGAPFQTLAAVVSAVGSKTNQRIGLARGSSWKEQFVLTNNAGTIIKDYGSGALPLIDGSDVILNASFALTSGKALTYEYAFTVTGSTGSEQRLIWEDGKCLTQVSSIANVEATAGSFFFSSYSASSGTLYVHATDGSDVTANGKLYEFTKRFNCLSLTGNNCRVENIRTRRQRNNNGSMEFLGDYCWAIGCTMEDGHKHCSYQREGGGYLNCTFKNAYNGISASPNYLVFNKDVAVGLGATVRGCTFTTDVAVVPSSGVTPTQFPSSILSHINTSGAFGTLTASGNTHNKTGGYSLGVFSVLNCDDDVWTNCSQMGASSDAIVATFNRPTVTKPAALSGTMRVFFLSSNPASGRVAVTYNNGSWNTALVSGRISGNSLDTTITNSTITTGAVGDFPVGAIRVEGTGNTLTVNNTTIDGRAWTGPAYLNLAADTTYVGDNNLFQHTAGTPAWQRANVTQATTLAGWRTYSGQDANSVAT
jgi:hypothetical protein